MILKAVNAAASLLNQGIDAATDYAKHNAMAIVILLSVVYFVRSRYSNGTTSKGYVLSQDGGTARKAGNFISANNSDALKRQEEMRQVRLRQQEIATQRAIEAEKIRKQKEAEERERKNNIAKTKARVDGERLGGESAASSTNKTTKKKSDDSGRGGGYNPMQPSSSQTSGYRPARRNPGA